jgi:hypothetical protein
MKIHEIIVEAIPISKYRKVIQQADKVNRKKVDYKSRYDELFGGEMRLYFPITVSNEGYQQFNDERVNANQRLIRELIMGGGFTAIDFKTNMVLDPSGRTLRLGKACRIALEKLRKYNENNRYMMYTLSNIYEPAVRQWERENQIANKEMQSKASGKQLMVVISRHPYDVASMSTGRDWSSCMHLDTGTNQGTVPFDIKYGTLIAYLTTADDKNINHPLGRVLIKPYHRGSSKSVVFGIENKTYPSNARNIPDWLDVVKQWVDDANAKAKSGIYSLPSNLYNDSLDNSVKVKK